MKASARKGSFYSVFENRVGVGAVLAIPNADRHSGKSGDFLQSRFRHRVHGRQVVQREKDARCLAPPANHVRVTSYRHQAEFRGLLALCGGQNNLHEKHYKTF